MNTSSPRPRGHQRPSSAIQIAMREYLARYGENAALAHFGLSRLSIARAAAGMLLQGGTILAIEDGLARARERDA